MNTKNTAYSYEDDETEAKCIVIRKLIREAILSVESLMEKAGDRDKQPDYERMVQDARRLPGEIHAAVVLTQLIQVEKSNLPDRFEFLFDRQFKDVIFNGLNVDLLASSLGRAHGVSLLLKNAIENSLEPEDSEMYANVAWDIAGRLDEARQIIDFALIANESPGQVACESFAVNRTH